MVDEDTDEDSGVRAKTDRDRKRETLGCKNGFAIFEEDAIGRDAILGSGDCRLVEVSEFVSNSCTCG